MNHLARIFEVPRPRERTPGDAVPLEHPLRRVRAAVDASLLTFRQRLPAPAASNGSSIWAEQALRALVLQFLFVMRRESQLIDMIWRNTLFRWFVGVRVDEPKWEPAAFARYRYQLLSRDIVRHVLSCGLTQAQREGLLSPRALVARQCELAQYRSDVVSDVGRPGVLPSQPRLEDAEP